MEIGQPKEGSVFSMSQFKSVSIYEQKSYLKKRILVVDDEEFCLETIKVLMRKAKIDLRLVDFCIDGQEAFDHVINSSRNRELYDLILTDFNMPVCDGIKATKKIRRFLLESEKI
jgi:CheY-like chemotaxis protein